MANRLIPALMLVAGGLAGPASAQTSLADAYKPHKPAMVSRATSGFATIRPLTPQKPFGGGEAFKPFTPYKPFEGQHIGSSRGGLDPYPHTKPASRSGAHHMFGAATEDPD